MKKLILVTLLTLSLAFANAQCWTVPDAPLATIEQNKAYDGNQRFEGSGTIGTNNNFNNWNYLIFNGSFTVLQTINFGNHSNVYGDGSVTFSSLNFQGGDTLFANGSMTIQDITSNNSQINQRNVIFLTETSSLYVKGAEYHIGDIIKLANNPTNEIDVLGCQPSTLPVTVYDYKLENGIISWKAGDQSTVDYYDVWGATDANGQYKVLEGSHRDVTPGDNGTSEYSVDIADYVVLSGAFALLFLMGTKRKSKILAIIGIIVMLAVACSNKNVSIPTTETKYTYFKVAIHLKSGTTIFSPIIK